jgi:hypothetical protein
VQNLFVALDGAATSSSFDLAGAIQTDGTFSLSLNDITSLITGAPVPDGAHALNFELVDNDGVTTSTSVNFTLASQVPTLSASLANPVGSGSAQSVSNTTDAITGNVSTEAALASLTGHFANSSLPGLDLTSQVQPDGSFSLSPAMLKSIAGGALQNGPHTLDLVATDAAGNSATVNVTFVVKSLTAALANDTGSNAHDGITSDDTVVGAVSTANGLSSLTGGLDGASAASFNLSSLVNPDGSFTLSPAALQNIAGSALADGSHTLHLAATDGSGNVDTFDLAFTLATKAPVLNAALSDKAAIKADGTTTDPSIAGTVTASDKIVSFTGRTGRHHARKLHRPLSVAQSRRQLRPECGQAAIDRGRRACQRRSYVAPHGD